ncbi:MAG: PA14 domain-containing protein [Pyrinomonadaceae bacterium]
MAVNNLKNKEPQNLRIDVAFGIQAASGDLAFSDSVSSVVYGYNALGEGEWDGVDQAYYKGVQIPATDLHFHSGALATGMTSGPQQVDSWFNLDVPHSRTAAVGYKVPTGLADADTEASPPDGFEGIFRTKKVADFDNAGTQTDFSFSANPARVIAQLLNDYARLPNVPTTYAAIPDYWKSRIDWAAWKDWRDYCATTETVDYTTLTDFDGFGLTATFFSDAALTTPVRTFVQPNIDSQGTSSAPPVYGVSGSTFSARFEGKLRAKYSETYTFRVTHDDGAKLWVNGSLIIDKWTTTGTDTGTIALTAGTLYDIKLEWKQSGGNWDCRLEWSSTSQPWSTIPAKYLYPLPMTKPRYESHIFWSQPTTIGAAIAEVLYITNSIMQEVNGKLRFFNLEQLTSSSFTLDDSNIDRLKFKRRDILKANPITAYEAKFRDLDSNYLEEPIVPVRYELDTYARKTAENVKVIDLYNTTRWQARKVIEMRAKLEATDDLYLEAQTSMAKTYPIVAGDLVTASHRKLGLTASTYLVREATDHAVSETSRQQSDQAEMRTLILQGWIPPGEGGEGDGGR